MTPITLRSLALSCLSSCLLACEFSGSASVVISAGDSANDSADEDGDDSVCGPKYAVVDYVIDGDTVVLESGETIRYLMIDTPELGECWSEEAKQANISFVTDVEIELTYDIECEDNYDRLLAYVWVDGTHINELMIQRGHARVLHIPPNGEEFLEHFRALEADAKKDPKKGLWASCNPLPF